ncbi:uncharacterized protein LOC114755677 [Neltuma alba]|uniref:uncharacterized protein LOC114755677 n=1 Tax=Neltuma alba TaxID=207710 RepID=UPI0010A310E8|nr:uncharacterized protein LOC114755677 [Prosopis alba]
MEQPKIWGPGSIIAFFIIVAIQFLMPLFMGPVSPPTLPLILIFPIVLATILIFLIITSN